MGAFGKNNHLGPTPGGMERLLVGDPTMGSGQEKRYEMDVTIEGRGERLSESSGKLQLLEGVCVALREVGF